MDLFTEFRNHTNGIPTLSGAGLLGALAHHGLDGIGTVEKDGMRDLVLRGGPWSDVERVRPFTSGRSRSWQFELRDGRKISAQGIPLRGVYGETHRMVTVASRPVAIDSGSSRPDDF